MTTRVEQQEAPQRSSAQTPPAERDARAVATDHRRRTWLVVALAGIVITALQALPLLPKSTFDRLLREDSWVEAAGAAAFLAAAAFACLAAIAPVPRGHQLRRVALVGLALAFFFAAGEEISWGQRLLGVETPEALRKVNTQDETTLHNIEGVGRLVEFGFALLWITVAIVVPALAALSTRLSRLLARVTPIIPLLLGLVFLWNYALSKVALRVFERWGGYESKYPVVHTTTEIKETGFAILFAVAMFLVWRHLRGRRGGTSTLTRPPADQVERQLLCDHRHADRGHRS